MSTTFMNLILPTVSSTIGPDWANNLNAAITLVDAHDHTTGKGTKVPVSGININSNLPFNNYSATNVGSATFSNLSALTLTLNTIYVKDGDLYFNDVNGSNVRLTASGAINTGSIGGIGGDYVSASATLYYTDATLKYTFEDGAAANANITVAAITATDVTASGTATIAGALTASGATTLAGATTISGAATVSGAANFTGNTTGRGILPVGSVIPLMSNLTGATAVTATTVADANGFVVCGGQVISDGTSPLNGQTIPNINNSVFLMGSGTAGTTGGANSITLSEAQLPAHVHTINHTHANSFALSNATFGSSTHTHGMAHTHQWAHYQNSNKQYYSRNTSSTASSSITNGNDTFWSFNDAGTGSSDTIVNNLSANTDLYTTGALSPPTGAAGATAATATPSATQTVTIAGSITTMTGNSGSTGSGSTVDNRPSFITAKYIMRVK